MLLFAVLIEDEKDELRFSELYLSYRKQMFFVANRILNRPELAEEAVQEALLRLARYIKSVPSEPEKCRTYVLTVAANCARDAMKAENRERMVQFALAEELQVDDSLFVRVIRSEAYSILRCALDQMEPIYRDVLMLHYVRQLTVKEISALLGRKANTVKQQIARGKKLLVERCREEGLSL